MLLSTADRLGEGGAQFADKQRHYSSRPPDPARAVHGNPSQTQGQPQVCGGGGWAEGRGMLACVASDGGG